LLKGGHLSAFFMPVLVQRQCKARKAGWRLSGWLNADELD